MGFRFDYERDNTMNKIVTCKAAKEAADKVAGYIKAGFNKVVDYTEVLVYWEDGRYNINVRAYFKRGKGIDGRGDYEVMKAMRQFGILECEAIVLQDGDGYKTYCGYSNWCDKEPEHTIADFKRVINMFKFTKDITATVVTKGEPFPTLYLQSDLPDFKGAVRSIETAVKVVRKFATCVAKVRECWIGEAKYLPNKKQQTATHAYKIDLI